MYGRALLLPVIAVQGFAPGQVILKASYIDIQEPGSHSMKHGLEPQVPLNLAHQ
jgi:hypothetical protein